MNGIARMRDNSDVEFGSHMFGKLVECILIICIFVSHGFVFNLLYKSLSIVILDFASARGLCCVRDKHHKS